MRTSKRGRDLTFHCNGFATFTYSFVQLIYKYVIKNANDGHTHWSESIARAHSLFFHLLCCHSIESRKNFRMQIVAPWKKFRDLPMFERFHFASLRNVWCEFLRCLPNLMHTIWFELTWNRIELKMHNSDWMPVEWTCDSNSYTICKILTRSIVMINCTR